ncbi:hypothetical protein [Streptosporangium canum]|uniref:hypothetical protein n=1 Tax=Streptosporangium canum TaxID=324952 RepID=UPI00379E123F
MDHEFPDDLIAAQLAYWEADRRVQEVTDALPSPQEVLEGAMSDEQQAELVQMRTARLDALDELNRHPFWETVDDRHRAWMALQKAAKG